MLQTLDLETTVEPTGARRGTVVVIAPLRSGLDCAARQKLNAFVAVGTGVHVTLRAFVERRRPSQFTLIENAGSEALAHPSVTLITMPG